jgi:uncharacterized protein YbgA (DUF1722 family)
MVIENQILSAMDSGSAYGSAGGTVMDQLNEIANRRAALNVLVQQQGTLLQKLSDEDWVNYSERLKAFGGIQTLQWLVQKYGNSERTGQ